MSVIRTVKKAVHKTTSKLTFRLPGGTFTWKSVRLTNYSPFVARVTGTSDSQNNPLQTLEPYQQNVYTFSGGQGPITVTFTQVTVTPLTCYFKVEYSSDPFPGTYPVPLFGNTINNVTFNQYLPGTSSALLTTQATCLGLGTPVQIVGFTLRIGLSLGWTPTNVGKHIYHGGASVSVTSARISTIVPVATWLISKSTIIWVLGNTGDKVVVMGE